MNRDAAGTDLTRVFGVPQMVEVLRQEGWTGADLKEYTTNLKRNGFDKLDEFSGGELSNLKGSPLYIAMLEITAIRYTLEQSRPGYGNASVSEAQEHAHEVA